MRLARPVAHGAQPQSSSHWESEDPNNELIGSQRIRTMSSLGVRGYAIRQRHAVRVPSLGFKGYEQRSLGFKGYAIRQRHA
eukprot:5862371-Prymnesium_polylepis.1